MRSRHRVGTMTWEDLQREARKLEQEVEGRLVEYSKFYDHYSQSSLLGSGGGGGIGSSGGGEEFDLEAGDRIYGSMATEIEQLLKRMSDIIADMSVTNQNSLLIHHYRGKLHDYTQEFKKTSGNIKSSREHAELLHSVRRDIKDAHNSESIIRRSVTASDRTASAIIEQAEQSQEALRNQKRSLMGAQSKMGGMDGMFSSIGSLMSQIQRKKMRDQIILAMVISFCATFIFLYWLRDQGMI